MQSKYTILMFHCNFKIVGGSKLGTLLTFWTGESAFKESSGHLIKFDKAENKLPMSETCFQSVTLPTKHEQYMEFKQNKDIALKYGSSGFAFH